MSTAVTKGRMWECIGERVRAARAERGISQGQLADRVGYTRASIANLEAGRQVADVVRMALVARALGVMLDDLVKLDDLTV